MLQYVTAMQELYFKTETLPIIFVGASALDYNSLTSGNSIYNIYAHYVSLHQHQFWGLMFEHYHFVDDYQLKEIQRNVFLPSAERAIVDTICHLKHNYIEGLLIEALQMYPRLNNNMDKLYPVAKHYALPVDTLDYWIDEARKG